jgi:hypothetical protein
MEYLALTVYTPNPSLDLNPYTIAGNLKDGKTISASVEQLLDGQEEQA